MRRRPNLEPSQDQVAAAWQHWWTRSWVAQVQQRNQEHLRLLLRENLPQKQEQNQAHRSQLRKPKLELQLKDSWTGWQTRPWKKPQLWCNLWWPNSWINEAKSSAHITFNDKELKSYSSSMVISIKWGLSITWKGHGLLKFNFIVFISSDCRLLLNQFCWWVWLRSEKDYNLPQFIIKIFNY